jgi:hypothetical protein
MENSQSVQQQSDSEVPIPEPESNKSRVKSSRILLVHLLAHYPWLFVTGLLGIFIGSAALSVYSLGYVGRVEKELPETKEVEILEPISTSGETSNLPPLWMLAAVALGCASGCLVILRLLKLQSQPKSFKKHINRYQVRLAQRQYQKTEPRPPINPPVFVPPPRVSILPSPSPSMPPMPTMKQAKPKPMVTVLPPEQKKSLNQQKESLADMMDIRKQSSLSAILHK